MKNTKNNPTKEAVVNCVLHNGWFIFFSIAALVLIFTSFFIPPMGVIDGSVLAATGEIFAFAALGTVIKAIDKGVDAQVQHNNTTITVGDLTKQDDNNESGDSEF